MAQIQTGVRLSLTSTFSICTQNTLRITLKNTLRITLTKNQLMSVYRLCDTDIEIGKIHKHRRGVHVLLICLEKQCEEIQRKANRVLAVLQRNIHFVPTKIKGHACYALVRPITEYSSTTWSPYTSKGIASIEAIRRRVARFVSNDYR